MDSNIKNSTQNIENNFLSAHRCSTSTTIPQIIIGREFKRYLNDTDNQLTVQSKASVVSVGRIRQMLKVVNANQQKKIRKCSVSYLGTIIPEHYEQRHQTSHYKRKLKVYNLMHNPRGFWGFIYHIFVFLMVFLCLILTVFSTDNKFQDVSWELMVEMERVMVAWFGFEFLVRLWASDCKIQYQGWKGKLKFLRNILRIGDIILIIVSIFLLWVDSEDGHLVFALFALRGFHRFFQVLQMVKTERQFRPASILYKVLSAQREQLVIVFYIGFLVLCFMAFLIYLVETGTNNHFDNIAESFYWAVITICTIGYGDRVPVTWLGKLITCMFTILGVSIFALPAGIIGTGLAISVTEEQREEIRFKKKIPAAILIQCCWRYYAANPESLSVATWKIHRWEYDLISEKERNAIRFMRMIKFLLAKQTFESFRTTTDVRDVIEQYRVGNSSVLYRIKEMQTDLSHLLGKVQINGHRWQESRNGLLEKINSIERMQNEIQTKLENKFEILFKQIENISKDLNNNHFNDCLSTHKTTDNDSTNI